MTRQEFSKVAAAIKCAFPGANIMPDSNSMDIWFMLLEDLDYQVCQRAVIEQISSNKYPPTIAEIREKCANLTFLPIKDYGEAWESVMKAIGRYGMYNPEEAYESMDELTRKCAKRIGFVNICTSENITADRANFRMIYETEAGKRKHENQLPQRLKIEKQSNEFLEMKG